MNVFQQFIILLSLLIFSQSFANSNHWKPKDGLSYIYLTWDKPDTSTHITINYHTSKNYEVPQVFYSEKPQLGEISKYESKTYGMTRTLPGIQRAFHRVTLNNLKPGTTYYFAVGDKNIGFSEEFHFKTIPNDGTPITFVTGGDMGPRARMGRILNLSAKTKPDFVAIGGDIAYGNGKLSNFDKWDDWLRMWSENMISPSGRMIPITLAIGNHEVGTGAWNYDLAPFYFALFEQGGLERAYFHRTFGKDTVLYHLDTGHLTPHFGRQKKWMKKTMRRHQHLENQLAIYHIPLYPSHRQYDGIPSTIGRKSWINTFDKYNLDFAFENHDHTMKVTHPLKGGEIVPEGEGTVYIGDGCWGRSPRKAYPGRWYLEASEAKVHFWHVTIKGKKIAYRAIDEENKTIYQSP